MWKRYGEEFDFDIPENEEIWENIVSYMDEGKWEETYFECTPCSNRYFLESYLEKDPEFEQLLAMEFSIEWM